MSCQRARVSQHMIEGLSMHTGLIRNAGPEIYSEIAKSESLSYAIWLSSLLTILIPENELI